jgi:uncharacterized protein (DUF4213/DUF364 family)
LSSAQTRPYELLLGQVSACPAAQRPVAEVLIGLTWTLCRAEGEPAAPESGSACGLAMSPGRLSRTLSWPGTLAGRPLGELADWLSSWDPFESTVGMAALNCALNPGSESAADATPLFPDGADNLAVFRHFAPRLPGKRVVVVGRYPGLESLDIPWELTVLERQPGPDDLPDTAAEALLPEADWVFLTGMSIPNKTFPRLAELAQDAQLVLMGPTVPWVPALRDLGVDYLAGVQVTEPERLRQTVAEGGGTRIFETGVRYAVLDLAASRLDRLRQAIAATVAARDGLKQEMDAWYGAGNRARFPAWSRLSAVDQALSGLDTRFKSAYDATEPRSP